jgi:hypothetical protein
VKGWPSGVTFQKPEKYNVKELQLILMMEVWHSRNIALANFMKFKVKATLGFWGVAGHNLKRSIVTAG